MTRDNLRNQCKTSQNLTKPLRYQLAIPHDTSQNAPQNHREKPYGVDGKSRLP
jgi:hypothetical protein